MRDDDQISITGIYRIVSSHVQTLCMCARVCVCDLVVCMYGADWHNTHWLKQWGPCKGENENNISKCSKRYSNEPSLLPNKP